MARLGGLRQSTWPPPPGTYQHGRRLCGREDLPPRTTSYTVDTDGKQVLETTVLAGVAFTCSWIEMLTKYSAG